MDLREIGCEDVNWTKLSKTSILSVLNLTVLERISQIILASIRLIKKILFPEFFQLLLNYYIICSFMQHHEYLNYILRKLQQSRKFKIWKYIQECCFLNPILESTSPLSLHILKQFSKKYIYRYVLDDRRIGVRFPVGADDLSSPSSAGAQTTSYKMATGESLPGGWNGRGVKLTIHHHLVSRTTMRGVTP
jgi:hypothetical protein